MNQAFADPTGNSNRVEACVWAQEDAWDMADTYNTQCGQCFTFIDGGPCEDGINFCCYCGKEIERHDVPEEDCEEDADDE